MSNQTTNADRFSRLFMLYKQTTQGDWLFNDDWSVILKDDYMPIVFSVPTDQPCHPSIHLDAIDNLDFIATVHRMFPLLEKELVRSDNLTVVLESVLESASMLRDQVEQMKGMFYDDDDAINDACVAHDKALDLVRSCEESKRGDL